MRKRAFVALVAWLVFGVGAPVRAAGNAPAHGDFQYFTFALTWQPGICGTDEGCLPDQPKTPLIGLHGLWASLPQTLVDAGVTPREWWRRGCDYFEHSAAPPALEGVLKQRLADVMPHFAASLLTHEYDKHVQCFKFDATQFFTTALAMRQAVADSSFGRYLLARAGGDVAHSDVVAAFRQAFSTNAGTSLQLQCVRVGSGEPVLTQLWITVEASALTAFPRPGSLIDAPIAQDDCPSTFLVPAWPPAPSAN